MVFIWFGLVLLLSLTSQPKKQKNNNKSAMSETGSSLPGPKDTLFDGGVFVFLMDEMHK